MRLLNGSLSFDRYNWHNSSRKISTQFHDVFLDHSGFVLLLGRHWVWTLTSVKWVFPPEAALHLHASVSPSLPFYFLFASLRFVYSLNGIVSYSGWVCNACSSVLDLLLTLRFYLRSHDVNCVSLLFSQLMMMENKQSPVLTLNVSLSLFATLNIKSYLSTHIWNNHWVHWQTYLHVIYKVIQWNTNISTECSLVSAKQNTPRQSSSVFLFPLKSHLITLTSMFPPI